MMTRNLDKTLIVLTLAALLPVPASAGSEGGPTCVNEHVVARDTDLYRITFEADAPATVSIRGNGTSDLDLEVRDERGNQICMADGLSDRESCRWTPRWTGEFEVRVINLGTIGNNYRICVN